MIFLMPYIQMTNTMFYRDIKGELYRQDPDPPLVITEREENVQDDYNSEA